MADELRVDPVRFVELGLERQDAEHEIDCVADRRSARLPPCPHLRAHVLHGLDACSLQRGRSRLVEILSVDTDERVDFGTLDAGHELAAQRENPPQVRQDLEEAHDGDLLGAIPRLTTGRDHLRPGHAHELGIGHLRFQRLDEPRPERVARRLPRDEGELERPRHGRR
jgi:hypothetical protein